MTGQKPEWEVRMDRIDAMSWVESWLTRCPPNRANLDIMRRMNSEPVDLIYPEPKFH